MSRKHGVDGYLKVGGTGQMQDRQGIRSLLMDGRGIETKLRPEGLEGGGARKEPDPTLATYFMWMRGWHDNIRSRTDAGMSNVQDGRGFVATRMEGSMDKVR